MDIATPGQFKKQKRVLNYAIQTKELNLKIKNEKVELEIFSDSDYSGDNEEV